MNIYKYTLKLLDPLFYSKEGLSGAITPKYIHATALNHAIAYALSVNAGNQPYIISDDNGGRNVPRYESSCISDEFYFTPARPIGNITYMPEIVKGDSEGFVRMGYGAASKRAEVLKAYQLFSIPPETEFEGYAFHDEIFEFPEIIRLGSFRGKARLNIRETKIVGEKKDELVDHPVDPLVSEVIRGVMVNMFPYPIIENAVCRDCVEIRERGFAKFIAIPPSFSFFKTERLATRSHSIIV